MAEEKVFANGFVFKRNENAPNFVVGRMSIKVEDAIAFLEENQKSGWVNLDVKQARSGNYYVELDTYEPKNDGAPKKQAPAASAPKPTAPQAEAPAEEEDDLPF